jgi:Tol biopolymer transport system component
MLALASSQGYLHIARVESPNTPARKLTDDEMLDRHARWSPDGEWIAIQSYRDGVHGVWLVRPDTGAVRVVPRSVGALQNPVWSPDGDQLAVWDSGVGGTRIVRLAGEAAPSETLPSLSQGGFVPGDWSPDGRLIAGTISGAIWIYSVEGRSYEQFRPGAHPVWLQDSRRIIYSYGGRLYMADTALGISRELLSLPDQQLDAPRLSRDNLHLYFTGSGEDANLWMMTLHGR